LTGINRSPWPAMRGAESLRGTAAFYGIFSTAELRGRALPSIHFIDAAEMTFPDDHFDAVISQMSIPYVMRKDHLLERVWRVLKPAGAAFLQMDIRHQDAPDFMRGDSPRFIVYQGGRTVPLVELLEAALPGRVEVRLDPLGDGLNLVLRKEAGRSLHLGLDLQPRSSFELGRLKEDPRASDGVLWGYRSVFTVAGAAPALEAGPLDARQ
jgi:SAM-dependent methyltransferase